MFDRDFKAVASHFSTFSPALMDYVDNVAFLASRYIFTHRQGKRQFGFCTHCRHEYETPGFRHGADENCLSCGSDCSVRASGKRRTKMVDEVYFVFYERSLVNPQAITARGFYGVRDYRGDFRAVETQLAVKAMYVFEPGKPGVMVERSWLYYSDANGMRSGDSWNQRKSVSSLGAGVMAHKVRFCSTASIKEAVQGTPFQYSTWESYPGSDMVKFFDLYAQYPCIEYLTKLGMRELVTAKLSGGRTYGAVNWRAKNPQKVLRMNKQEINELRASGVQTDPWLLYLFQRSKKDGSNFSIPELVRFGLEVDEYRIQALKRMLTRTTLRRFDTYLVKQLRHPEVCKHYHTRGQILGTWDDYMSDCVRLGLDARRESVLFPKNLYRAHQNTIKQVKVKEDKELQAQVVARSKRLQKFRFEADGFILRPAANTKELIDEGKALEHCVGTYAARYAKGETDIFVLRNVDEPDKPFYTMEVCGGSVVQCRGLKNCMPTQEVRLFIELFVAKKLLTKKRTRVGIAV